ncbi:MAG: TonB-dependent receptor [Pyrinomonadaceae bacterium]
MKFFLFFLVLCCALPLAAQPTSSISGTIRDVAGASVGSADVRIVNTQQVVIAVAVSDPTGSYKFENIKNGSYVIKASRNGFSPADRAIRLSGEGHTNVDLTLEINQFKEQVTVTADTGLASETSLIPQSINVISQDAISQRTTNVLAQVAEEETGASMQRTSPTIGAVLVRGLTEVGVYVDGVRYTNSTQRGGINTFFNLNEPTSFQSVEIQRSPNTAQFGSDGLGGNVQLISRQPGYGYADPRWDAEVETFYGAADNSFGGNTLLSYGGKKFGVLGNLVARRINTLRPGGGIDSHSAITRFFDLPSDIIGSSRLPDTAFTQYSGTFHASLLIADDQNLSFRYQRSQQDGGKRYDQLLGGDGNLIAELKNLMLDFGYIRYNKVGFGFFDNLAANISYNSQREQRVNQGGQGNPFNGITNDKERTSTYGAAFHLSKQFLRNDFLVGGDYYYDTVSAPSFNIDPVTSVATIVRPRVPNGATYKLSGVYLQDVFNVIPGRLRVSGSLRYNVGKYRSRAADAPVVNGTPLFPDDSGTFKDLSGRIGATVTLVEGLNAAFNYSRGFRAPNITSLGSLGLVGVGFQVSTADVIDLGATIGSTADETAVSTGITVSPLNSELSDNYDFALRFNNDRLDLRFTTFLIDYTNTIVRQTLILPQGAVGTMLGSQTITNQNANGAVFVPASTSPVLVQANFNESRLNGIELSGDVRVSSAWTVGGNYSFTNAKDRVTGEPPNLGGGGIPPALGFLRLRYQPVAKKYWFEGYTNIAGEQDRLSSLDLSDRRTGGGRSRNQIQNFFRRGACVRGITTVGSSGQCTSAGGILIATGETLQQVQDRVLPIGATINGVLIVDNSTVVPLFRSIPSYILFGVRGGFRFDEKHEVLFDLKNIADRSHRLPGWGVDGPGRNFVVRYRYRF